MLVLWFKAYLVNNPLDLIKELYYIPWS